MQVRKRLLTNPATIIAVVLMLMIPSGASSAKQRELVKSNTSSLEGRFKTFTINELPWKEDQGSFYAYFCVSIDGRGADDFGSLLQFNVTTVDGSEGFQTFYPSQSGESGCQEILVRTIESLDFRLDTWGLPNGDHSFLFVFRGGYNVSASGEYTPYLYDTSFNFHSQNAKRSFGTASWGFDNPSCFGMCFNPIYGKPMKMVLYWVNPYPRLRPKIRFSVLQNGYWKSIGDGKFTTSEFGDQTYYVSKQYTFFGPSSVRAIVTLDGASREWVQKTSVDYTMNISYPTKVIVGRTGTASLSIPGISSARCGVQLEYKNFQNATIKTSDYGIKVYNSKASISVKLNSSGSVNGTVTCYIPKGKSITQYFYWPVTWG